MFPNLAAPCPAPALGIFPWCVLNKIKTVAKKRAHLPDSHTFRQATWGKVCTPRQSSTRGKKKSEHKIKLACKHLNILKEKEKDAPLYKLSTLSLSGHSGKERSGKQVSAKSMELVLRCGCFWIYLIRALLHFSLFKCLLLFLNSE